MQVEALMNLAQLRKQGESRAIIVSATGTGKTYLSAFDVRQVKPNRMLYIAQQEQILKKTEESFQKVLGCPKSELGLFSGGSKESDRKYVFATVQTMSRPETLAQFDADEFDYILVDEVHHAAAESYKRVIDHFQPNFMLGMTATPERTDGANIFELFGNNVAYEIRLQKALEEDMLCPFHYYGVHEYIQDAPDEKIAGKDVKVESMTDQERNELSRWLEELADPNRVRYIIDKIQIYSEAGTPVQGLVFCSRREEAKRLSDLFNQQMNQQAERPYRTKAITGENSQMERDTAVAQLENGELDYIFTVDLFNEGVDIPAVDMVMFLRPTESPIVFLQQLGRGLRKSMGKEYLNVLDFIGNYEKAGRVRFLLTGKTFPETKTYNPADRTDFPDDCMIDFDLELIDLFSEMDKRTLRVKDCIRGEYYRVKNLLDKSPSRLELFTYMDDDVYQLVMQHSKENPFKRYLDYKKELDELSEIESAFLQDINGRDFIHLIETTNMTKVYKMPVLMAFYNHGDIRMEVTEQQLLVSWKEFFSTGTNWKDLDKDMTYEKYMAISDKEHINKILKMPVHFLQESGDGFFVKRDGCALALSEKLQDVIDNPVFVDQMRDVIRYRTMDYYQRRYRGI